MSRKWTDEQQSAIDTKNKRILVSAAAGSGKTAVLVERIISQITDEKNPVDIDELLVMTFTKAAAMEMKERIGKSLEQKLSASEFNSATYLRLKKQLSLIDSAHISTIDSFCLFIIKEHMDKLKLDHGFRIAESSELDLLRAEAMDELMEELYQEKDEDFIRLLDSFTTVKSDNRLREYIESIYTYAYAMPMPKVWLKSIKDSYFADEDKSWETYIVESIKNNAKDIRKDIDRAIALCDEGALEGYRNTFITEASLVDDLSKVHNYDELRLRLKAFEFPMIGRLSKDADVVLKEIAKGIRDAYKKFIKESLIKNFIREQEELDAEYDYEKKVVCTLIDIVERFIDKFVDKKLDKNIADFADLEHYALDILFDKDMNRTDIALEYASHFKDIYIDEYQDSNYVQESILSALESGNVFMVGDVKQSIYAFRQAKPELFLSKYHSYKQYESAQEDKDIKIVLKKNFRSRDIVLSSINKLFFKIMQSGVGGIDYDEDAALYPGADFKNIIEQGASTAVNTKLLILDNSDTDEEKTVSEALMVAGEIKRILSSLMVLDADTREYRRARYSDIVIMLRSMQTQSELFLDILSKEGIPAFVATSKGYFSAMEVRQILSILQAIDNPYMDIAFLSYLQSPIVDLTEAQISTMKIYYRKYAEKLEDKEAKTKLYEISLAIAHKEFEPGDAEIVKKLEDALKLLDDYRKKASYMKLSDFLMYIYDQSEYLDIVSLMPAGNIRRANLLMLLEMSKQYESIGYRGLFNFIRYIEKLREYDTDYGEAGLGAEQEDTVKIMSIHKSKGLEFPVCFVSGLHKRFNTSDQKTALIADDKFGLACDYVDLRYRSKRDSIKKNVIKYKKKIDSLGEELRVLYVALSRAKEQLILTAVVDDVEKALEKYSHIEQNDEKLSTQEIMSAASYLDFILMARESMASTLELAVVKPDIIEDGELKKQLGIKELRKQLDELKPIHDEELDRRIYKDYDYAADIELHTKLSVSDIKKALWEEESKHVYSEDKTLSLEDKEAVKLASERGNAYHKLMQIIDFKKASVCEDISAYMDELVEQNHISKEYRKLIDDKHIFYLLKSELSDILIKASDSDNLKREAIFTMGVSANELGIAESEETILIQGIIDAYIELEDEIILIDYKTDRVKDEEELIKRYELQLYYYAKALSMMKKKEVKRKMLWSFSLNKAISC